VTLKQARDRREQARSTRAEGEDPGLERKTTREAQGVTFEVVAREHLEIQREAVSDGTVDLTLRRLDRYVFPILGKRPIADIAAAELLSVLRKVESRGIHEMAHRLRAVCGRIFRYAIATGRAERDVAAELRGALAPVKGDNLAAITEPAKVGALLRAIDGYQGQYLTKLAMKLAASVFVRPGELRKAEWSEFDLDRAEWRIAGERMKMGEPHLVPLCRQALDIVRHNRTSRRRSGVCSHRYGPSTGRCRRIALPPLCGGWVTPAMK
jgi:integrase